MLVCRDDTLRCGCCILYPHRGTPYHRIGIFQRTLWHPKKPLDFFTRLLVSNALSFSLTAHEERQHAELLSPWGADNERLSFSFHPPRKVQPERVALPFGGRDGRRNPKRSAPHVHSCFGASVGHACASSRACCRRCFSPAASSNALLACINSHEQRPLPLSSLVASSLLFERQQGELTSCDDSTSCDVFAGRISTHDEVEARHRRRHDMYPGLQIHRLCSRLCVLQSSFTLEPCPFIKVFTGICTF